MTHCTSQPISWYKLERLRLGQLAHAEQASVEAHLSACPTCGAAYARTGEPRELRALELPDFASIQGPARHTQRSEDFWTRFARWKREVWLGSFAFVTAVALLVVLRTSDGPSGGPGLEPPAHITVKGGELSVQLVRSSFNGLARATHFAPGDRFKLQLSCPPGFEGHVDSVVYQGDQAYFPLAPMWLEQCANGVVMPGAFSLSGREDAVVCLVFGRERAVDRDGLKHVDRALPEHSLCERVAAVRP